MPDIEPNPPQSNMERFRLICWGRATLYSFGEYSLQDAVDGCLAHALALSLCDMDAVQKIMADEFIKVRNDL